MNASSLPETLTQLITPLAESLGLTLWGLELAFGGQSLVRVYAEGPDGITIDQCAELSRLIALTLDVEDCMTGAYVLEVSSPGLERVFFKAEQLTPHVGKILEVVLHEPVPAYPGRRKFTGELGALTGELITLSPTDVPTGGETPVPLVFAWGDARKIRLVHFIPEPEGPAKGKKGRTKTPQARKTPQDQQPSAEADAPSE